MQFVNDAELKFVEGKMAEVGYPPVETYIPEYQQFAVPTAGERKFWHFKFKSDKGKIVEGFNAGLILDFMKYSPVSWPALVINDINRPKFAFDSLD